MHDYVNFLKQHLFLSFVALGVVVFFVIVAFFVTNSNKKESVIVNQVSLSMRG